MHACALLSISLSDNHRSLLVEKLFAKNLIKSGILWIIFTSLLGDGFERHPAQGERAGWPGHDGDDGDVHAEAPGADSAEPWPVRAS